MTPVKNLPHVPISPRIFEKIRIDPKTNSRKKPEVENLGWHCPNVPLIQIKQILGFGCAMRALRASVFLDSLTPIAASLLLSSEKNPILEKVGESVSASLIVQ
jgi:hypothetical protein